MEFPAVIICLLAVGCVRDTMSHVSRQTRQIPTPATLPAPAVPSKNYNNTQLPYPYPTYPIYQSNVNPIEQSAAPTNVPQTISTISPQFISTISSQTISAISPSTNSTSLLDTSTSKSFLQHAKTYSVYALQVLMIVLLGTSLLNYICLQWPNVCDKVFGEDNFWKDNNKTRRLNRSYVTSNYLNDISSTVFKAMDYYNKQQN